MPFDPPTAEPLVQWVPVDMHRREHPISPKADPNAWLGSADNGSPILFASAEDVPEGRAWIEPLAEGDIVPMVPVRDFGAATLIVQPDRTWQVDRPQPAESNWAVLHDELAAANVPLLLTGILAERRTSAPQRIRYLWIGQELPFVLCVDPPRFEPIEDA